MKTVSEISADQLIEENKLLKNLIKVAPDSVSLSSAPELTALQKVVNDTILGILVNSVDKKGRLHTVWTNETCENFLGYSLQELQKLCFKIENSEIFHEDDTPAIKHTISEIMSGKRKEASILFRIYKKTGEKNWVYLYSKAIEYNGKGNHLLSIGIDFTDHMVLNKDHLDIYTKEIAQLKNELILSKLTRTEKVLIGEIASGKTTKMIAEERERSYETINNHKRNIFKKLNLNKVSELVIFAVENGLK
ncbi:MAG: LuxR C-terminal-related transcriptional regulator [Bacteroidales bacterium]|jgi:PAS domain S-box-containing protein|nr:LuxR C-terminal-related transcriptional regulator [Bacteroidales bacterium]